MRDRIQNIIDYKGLNFGKFADIIGIQRSALSHIMSGRNNPSLDVLTKILNSFPDISTDWLMFGKDQMLDKKYRKVEIEQVELFSNEIIDNQEEYSDENTETDKQENEKIIIKEIIKEKKISKIMIFYSDNTFENFIPETKY